jgi:hypothetical protein
MQCQGGNTPSPCPYNNIWPCGARRDRRPERPLSGALLPPFRGLLDEGRPEFSQVEGQDGRELDRRAAIDVLRQDIERGIDPLLYVIGISAGQLAGDMRQELAS